MSEDSVQLRLHGKDLSPETLKEAGEALQGLMREVTSVKWKLGPWRIVCDGCGRERPEEHDDWIHHAGDDVCPACQRVVGVPGTMT